MATNKKTPIFPLKHGYSFLTVLEEGINGFPCLSSGKTKNDFFMIEKNEIFEIVEVYPAANENFPDMMEVKLRLRSLPYDELVTVWMNEDSENLVKWFKPINIRRQRY